MFTVDKNRNVKSTKTTKIRNKKMKFVFPHRESNPGRLGENQKS